MRAEVRLHFCHLDSLIANQESPANLLDNEESDRAARFHFQQDRERWVVSRQWLRECLGQATAADPASLIFRIGFNGKPKLDPQSVHFNLSHSHGWAGLATCSTIEVGFDLELPQRQFPISEVAPEVFTTSELSMLKGFHPERQRELFYTYWTAKEALMKATSLGVELPPDEIELNLDAVGTPLGYLSHPEWALCIGSQQEIPWAIAAKASSIALLTD